MSILTEAMRALRKVALLDEKADRALKIAEDAQRHSTENRERIIALEIVLQFVAPREGRQPRLPRN